MATQHDKIRILIAKPGLDGHDRGAKVIAYALRDAGMEVIYTGLRQSVENIIAIALQEDVDAIGLSILSGAHRPLTEQLMAGLCERAKEIAVLVGGTVPERDIPALLELGVSKVFPTGTPLSAIAGEVRAAVEAKRAAAHTG